MACPAAVTNLRCQEHLSGLPLQIGTRQQALLMTQTRAEAPWSLLQLDLVALAGCHQKTTLCSVDPRASGSTAGMMMPYGFLFVIIILFLALVLSMSVSVCRVAAESCSGQCVQFICTRYHLSGCPVGTVL